jgi:hypothetical protein
VTTGVSAGAAGIGAGFSVGACAGAGSPGCAVVPNSLRHIGTGAASGAGGGLGVSGAGAGAGADSGADGAGFLRKKLNIDGRGGEGAGSEPGAPGGDPEPARATATIYLRAQAL